MSILSKILVTLLCSCKSAAAAGELKRVIRQFREAAREATDEVGEDLLAMATSGRSSKSGKRRRTLRNRKSSGSSNASHSEAESQTSTLTPQDSKSSGTDEDATGSNTKQHTPPRLRFNVIVDSDAEAAPVAEATVSFTVSLPRRSSLTSEEQQQPEQDEWNCETDADCGSENNSGSAGSNLSPKSRRFKMMGVRHDSTSSDSAKEVSSDGKSETRKLLNEMADCGAYNSDSINSPGHSGLSDLGAEQSRGSPTHNWSSNDDDEHSSPKKRNSREEVDGQLFNYLEETFKVLNGAYQIITGSSYNSEEDEVAAKVAAAAAVAQQKADDTTSSNKDQSFDEVLEGVSSQCAMLETEMRTSTTPSESLQKPGAADSLLPVSPYANTGARPKSQQSSRPTSRNLRSGSRVKGSSRPTSRQSVQGSGEEEEEWGDDYEWEYYDEEGEEEGCEEQQERTHETNAPVVKEKPVETEKKAAPQIVAKSIPPLIVVEKEPDVVHSTEVSKRTQEMKAPIAHEPSKPESRPTSAQRKVPPPASSRPTSRSGSRPVSRSSRMGRRTPLKGIEEDNDWEWEYYYEEGEDDEEEELNRLSPSCTTAPTTRATSPFPLSADSKSHTPYKEPAMPEVCRASVRSPPSGVSWEEVNLQWQAEDVASSKAIALEKVHGEPGLIHPISEVSVALAAEYLGQKACQVAASLPQCCFDGGGDRALSCASSRVHNKKSKKSKHSDQDQDQQERKEKKKHKKKKKKRRGDDEDDRPKMGVKDLVNILEPRLFQDQQTGTRMVMSEESSRYSMAEKRSSRKFQQDLEREEAETGMERRASVRQIVQLITKPATPEPEQPVTLAWVPSVDYVAPQVVYVQPQPPPPPPPPPFVDPMDVRGAGRVLEDTLHQSKYQPEPVIRNIPNSGKVEVIQGETSTVVTMRNKSGRPGGGRSQQQTKDAQQQQQQPNTKSPNGSEAYGTGSSCSGDNQGNHQQARAEDGSPTGSGGGDAKKPNRHSRLFRLLQDSDYTDSDSTEGSSADSTGRIALKGMDDLLLSAKKSAATTAATGGPADVESIGSGAKLAAANREVASQRRQSSLCSRESDCDSLASSSHNLLDFHTKPSPPILRKEIASRRFMNLNLQTCYDPSSATGGAVAAPEFSSPTSPIIDASSSSVTTNSLKRRSQQQQQLPPQQPRVWSYLQDEFSSGSQQPQQQQHFSQHDDSSYYSQSHSQLSLDSIATPDGCYTERRAVSREHSFRSLKGENNNNGASPSLMGRMGSPKLTHHRNSPKIEMELAELANLPPASGPALDLRSLRGHFGGGGGGGGGKI